LSFHRVFTAVNCKKPVIFGNSQTAVFLLSNATLRYTRSFHVVFVYYLFSHSSGLVIYVMEEGFLLVRVMDDQIISWEYIDYGWEIAVIKNSQ